MKIQDMFQRDIDRDIDGVVKVFKEDEQSLKQELSEYIITRELRKHFTTFFDNYVKAIDHPTDKIGVWISGFFGSGKSHFLKILSYLLSNKEVGGKCAFDYFADKFGDPMLYANVQKCVLIPTESILFNIGIEGGDDKDKTTILRVFTKVFYNHCGFYGEDLKIAKLERFIEKQGKTAEFYKVFKEINGDEWVNKRDSVDFIEDDMVETLKSVLGMSETSARNWFNGEETVEISVKKLVSEIEEYVESKGEDFRLLFMVDEIGQYIGEDTDLMLNLQSLVEEIGAKCRGKVWVMVTSQEVIDSVVKVVGNDFSKIQGRFDTRLNLSSSSVDEVIQKRLLEKTEDATHLLQMEYEKEASGLKSLFAFDNPIKDIKGFTNAEEFSATFPFVPYQFIVIQKVLREVRKHENVGVFTSEGERSMLSSFKEVAKKVENKDETALVPFYQFYDTVHTFFKNIITGVINRCQKAADEGNGLEQQDVDVLKLLYLVRYIEDVKANVENIAILMIDNIHTDKVALRASITTSLERLLSQNYISRSGDTYAFLTDEEQDVARDIKNTVIDSARIIQSITQTIYGAIYLAKKYKYGKYDFDYDQYVDENLNGTSSGGMRLRIITVANDLYGAGEKRFIMDSHVNNEAIVVLSDETPYFDELEQAEKIRKYVKQRNVSQLPESIQRIIRDRNDEARKLESHARSYIEKAIVDGRFYVHGEILELKSGSAKDKLDAAMKNLVESVYSKLNMVNQFAESDADILTILKGVGAEDEPILAGTSANNADALNEISQWLELQNQKMLKTSMGDVQRRYQAIPYGWKEIDIAAMAARLIVQQKIQIQYGGAVVGKEERRLVDLLRKKSEVDKALVVRRVAPSEELIRKSGRFLREYLGVMDIPSDEDGLIRFVLGTFEQSRDHYQELLDKFYAKEKYPQKQVVIDAKGLMEDVLSQKKDNVALLNHMVQIQDDLFASLEDMEDVEAFFKAQKTVFDDARKQLEAIRKERDYFAADEDTVDIINTISSILAMEKPYPRIGELPELVQKVKKVYGEMLDLKREEVNENIKQCMGDIHQLAEEARDAGMLLKQADTYFSGKRDSVQEATSLTDLDAMITRNLSYKDNICRRMEVLSASAKQQTEQITAGEKQTEKLVIKPKKITTLRRYDLCGVKRLQSKEEVDKYVEGIREKLYQALEKCDGVQVN